ncbi:unnamed protein product, partial [Prorocentrum cordatum]
MLPTRLMGLFSTTTTTSWRGRGSSSTSSFLLLLLLLLPPSNLWWWWWCKTGPSQVAGHGQVSLVSAGANVPGEPAAETEVMSGSKLVVPHMGARVYFADGADGCAEGDYDPSVYSAINFLGKKITWTTDVSGTNCGCNAAFYLVSMQQNTEIGTCNDYYCDAQSVCGVPCGEIDLMEA